MNRKQHDCVSQEFAQALLEAGWDTPTRYVWQAGGHLVLARHANIDIGATADAPTGQELLDQLSKLTNVTKTHSGHYAASARVLQRYGNTMADALAHLWIALCKHKDVGGDHS